MAVPSYPLVWHGDLDKMTKERFPPYPHHVVRERQASCISCGVLVKEVKRLHDHIEHLELRLDDLKERLHDTQSELEYSYESREEW